MVSNLTQLKEEKRVLASLWIFPEELMVGSFGRGKPYASWERGEQGEPAR